MTEDEMDVPGIPARPRHGARHGGQWPTHTHKGRRRRANARWLRRSESAAARAPR